MIPANTATYNSTYPDEQEISLVKSAGELFAELIPKTALPEKKQNVRKELLNELYTLYLNHANKELRIRNRKRYNYYIRLHHPTALSKESDYNSFKDEFRNAKLDAHKKYLSPIKSSDYRWWGKFTHLKEDALRHMISVARSMEHRKGNVSSYILGATKAVEKPIEIL